MRMSPPKYFEYIKSKTVKEFLKFFGGNFSYCSEFGYVYEYDKKMFFLAEHDFKKDITNSIKNDENLLLTYTEVHW